MTRGPGLPKLAELEDDEAGKCLLAGPCDCLAPAALYEYSLGNSCTVKTSVCAPETMSLASLWQAECEGAIAQLEASHTEEAELAVRTAGS